jgi:ammonia channel protein AmtB
MVLNMITMPERFFAGGWLAEHGFVDFAGSGVVHLAGGTCALVCKFLMMLMLLLLLM